MRFLRELFDRLNLRKWLKPTPDERLSRAILKVKVKAARRLEKCFYELQFRVHDDFRGSLHSVPTFEGLCEQIDALSRAYAHLKVRESKLVKLLDIADSSSITREVERLVEIDLGRDREKEQVRKAFRLGKIARDSQAQSQAALYSLTQKFDQEDRNYWPKNRS